MDSIVTYFNQNQYLLYIIIAIIVILIILGVVYFRKTIDKETDFEQLVDLPFDIKELENAVGGLENINSVEGTISKAAFKLKDTSLVDLDKMKELGASGIVETKSGFTFILGHISKTVATLIQRNLDNK